MTSDPAALVTWLNRAGSTRRSRNTHTHTRSRTRRHFLSQPPLPLTHTPSTTAAPGFISCLPLKYTVLEGEGLGFRPIAASVTSAHPPLKVLRKKKVIKKIFNSPFRLGSSYTPRSRRYIVEKERQRDARRRKLLALPLRISQRAILQSLLFQPLPNTLWREVTMTCHTDYR